MDFGAVFVATCLATAIATLIMGLSANYPIALAPGMGQNAFFAYGIVLGMGHNWQTALGAVFISGLLFILISLLPIREKIINSIPTSLKIGITAGIGFFLVIISLKGSNIIISQEATLLTLGDLTAIPALLIIGGFIVITGLTARRIKGAVIIGILLATFIGWLTGITEFKGVVSLPPSMAPIFLQMDVSSALNSSMITIILTLLLVDVFDTTGTLIGVGKQANLLDKDGRLTRLRNALLADSSATAIGAVLGTSSTTSYIESAAGVQAGGRTGLTSVATALLFVLCLIFAPLAQTIPAFATGATLLFVGSLMAQSLKELNWDDITESAPAMITALMMPLSYSIANGLGIGFICYVGIKIISGKANQCSLMLYLIAMIFLLKFLFL